MDEEKKPKEFSIWHLGLYGVSVAFILTMILAVPWTYYSQNELRWQENASAASVLALIAIFNAFSLIFRLRIIENENIALTDFSHYQIVMTISSVGNILFWTGLAMWLVYQDLHISRLLCYIVSLTGATVHSVLHYKRWHEAKSTTTSMLLALYIVTVVALTWAYFTGKA